MLTSDFGISAGQVAQLMRETARESSGEWLEDDAEGDTERRHGQGEVGGAEAIQLPVTLLSLFVRKAFASASLERILATSPMLSPSRRTVKRTLQRIDSYAVAAEAQQPGFVLSVVEVRDLLLHALVDANAVASPVSLSPRSSSAASSLHSPGSGDKDDEGEEVEDDDRPSIKTHQEHVTSAPVQLKSRIPLAVSLAHINSANAANGVAVPPEAVLRSKSSPITSNPSSTATSTSYTSRRIVSTGSIQMNPLPVPMRKSSSSSARPRLAAAVARRKSSAAVLLSTTSVASSPNAIDTNLESSSLHTIGLKSPPPQNMTPDKRQRRHQFNQSTHSTSSESESIINSSPPDAFFRVPNDDPADLRLTHQDDTHIVPPAAPSPVPGGLVGTQHTADLDDPDESPDPHLYEIDRILQTRGTPARVTAVDDDVFYTPMGTPSVAGGGGLPPFLLHGGGVEPVGARASPALKRLLGSRSAAASPLASRGGGALGTVPSARTAPALFAAELEEETDEQREVGEEDDARSPFLDHQSMAMEFEEIAHGPEEAAASAVPATAAIEAAHQMVALDDLAAALKSGEGWEGEGKGMGGVMGGDEIVPQETIALHTTITTLRRALLESQRSLEYLTKANDAHIKGLVDEAEKLRVRKYGAGSVNAAVLGCSVSLPGAGVRAASLDSGSTGGGGGFGTSLGSVGSTGSGSLMLIGGGKKARMEEIEFLEDELRRLTKELTDSRALNSRLRAQLDRRAEEKSKLSDELDEKDGFIRGLEYRVEVFEKEIKKKTEESTTLASLVTRLQHDLMLSAHAVSNLTDENRALGASVAALQANMKDIMATLNVEEEDDEAGGRTSVEDVFHEPMNSLHYELENSLSSISPNNFLDSGSFLASIAKVATTRQNSTQTDPPATFTLSTQYDRDEHTLSAGTNTRPVVVTSSAAQADAVHFRDTFAQSSPVDVMSVSIGAGCGIAGLVDAGVECAPWEFSASGEGVAVQTMDYGSDSGVDVGVQAGRVLLHDAVAVQTERAVCRDSGVVGEVDVAPVAVVPVAVQTLWEAEARGTQTLRVKAVASSVQTEVGPGDAVSVQTERLGVDGFVQTERAAVIENGVQTEVVLAHHGGFQTDTVLLLDWGMQTDDVKVMERGMETEFVMRAEGTMQTEFLGVDTVVQTEFHSISFASQTDVVCGIASSTQTQFSGAHRSAQTDAVSVTTREVQVGQRVDSLPRGVQTDRADCVSAAFGLLTYGRGVQTDLDGDDVSNLEVDVERLRARCDDLEREVLAFDGEREMVVVFEAELRMLEKTCATLREKLSTAQSDILENRRQFNLRKHYDSEVERWIDQLKRDMDEYESVLGHARDAIERQQGTDKILMERLLHIEDIKNDYKEAVRACQEAKVAAEEKFAQQNLNVSSLPVHERIAPEPWSDDESSEVSPIMKRTKQFSRNCSSAISSTLTKRVTVGSVIAPVLLLSTLVSVGIAVSSYDISTLANSSGLTTTCAVMEGVFGGVGTRDVEQSRKPGDTTFWGHVDKSFARLEQVVSGVKDNEIEVLPM